LSAMPRPQGTRFSNNFRGGLTRIEEGTLGGQMTSFEDREKGFERKFAHDEELKFKATARRNKLLGLWAAGEMGITGDAAQAYAREVIKADLEQPGEEDLFRKIRKDFDAKGVQQSDHQIRHKMSDLMSEALIQIEAEGKA
jgi:hypothetical protein